MNYKRSEAKEAAKEQFRGVWAAITTPFTPDDRLDEAGLRRNMRRYTDGLHVDGIFCTGTMGEFWALTKEERKRAVEIVVEEAHGKCKVIAHTGHHSPNETVDLTRHAQDIGADFAIVINPYYPWASEDTLYEWFKLVAARVDIGIWMFDTPFSGVEFSPQLTARIARIENICGIKCSRPLGHYEQARTLCGDLIAFSHPSETEFLKLMRDHDMKVHMSSAAPFLMQVPGYTPMRDYAELALAGRFNDPMDNDWNNVRRELDKSDHFEAICNSPWYTDAVYEKFPDEEFARRHEAARKIMVRDGLDALILTGGPDIYSHGSGVTWGAGLIDDRGMCQYMVLPLKGDPTLIYPHYGCHIEAARKMVSVKDVRSGQHGKYGKAVAERLIELKLQKARIGITAADRTGPEFMGVQAYQDMLKLLPQATFVFCPNLLHELTYRKSAAELKAMARAGQLAIKALEAVKATAKPGVREYQLAGAVANAVLGAGGRYHLLMIGSTSMRDPKIIFPNPNPSARMLKEGDIVLSELAMSYMGYSAKIGHPVSIGRPTEQYQTFFKDVVVGGFKEVRALLKPGTTLEEVRKVGAKAFRSRGAQSRPTIMHGLDLITSVPFIRADRVRAEPYETTMQPGMTYNIEITPVDKEGVFGIFYSRSFAITDTGRQDLTPYDVDEILVAG